MNKLPDTLRPLSISKLSVFYEFSCSSASNVRKIRILLHSKSNSAIISRATFSWVCHIPDIVLCYKHIAKRQCYGNCCVPTPGLGNAATLWVFDGDGARKIADKASNHRRPHYFQWRWHLLICWRLGTEQAAAAAAAHGAQHNRAKQSKAKQSGVEHTSINIRSTFTPSDSFFSFFSLFASYTYQQSSHALTVHIIHRSASECFIISVRYSTQATHTHIHITHIPSSYP